MKYENVKYTNESKYSKTNIREIDTQFTRGLILHGGTTLISLDSDPIIELIKNALYGDKIHNNTIQSVIKDIHADEYYYEYIFYTLNIFTPQRDIDTLESIQRLIVGTKLKLVIFTNLLNPEAAISFDTAISIRVLHSSPNSQYLLIDKVQFYADHLYINNPDIAILLNIDITKYSDSMGLIDALKACSRGHIVANKYLPPVIQLHAYKNEYYNNDGGIGSMQYGLDREDNGWYIKYTTYEIDHAMLASIHDHHVTDKYKGPFDRNCVKKRLNFDTPPVMVKNWIEMADIKSDTHDIVVSDSDKDYSYIVDKYRCTDKIVLHPSAFSDFARRDVTILLRNHGFNVILQKERPEETV